MTISLTDLHLLFRSLAKNPLFSLLIVATLAVGVGATTATFTYVGSFLWDSYTPDPETLMQLQYTDPGSTGISRPMSYLDFLDFRREARDVGEVVAWWIWGQGVRKGDNVPAWAWGHSVSDGYFDVLRARPAAGRLFGADDHRPGAARAAVLGYRFWRRHFDLRSEAIGQSLQIGGQSYTIIGVTDAAFIGTGLAADMYIPIQYTRDGASEWNGTVRDPARIVGGRVWAITRLARDISHEQARGRFAAIAEALNRSHPAETGPRELDFDETRDGNTERALQGALRLLGAAGLLLLLTLANVANLLLARYLERRRDVSIMAALGASRRRITTVLLAECLVLAVLGGVLGIAVSRVLVSIMRRILMSSTTIDMGNWSEGVEDQYLTLDWRVAAFSLATSLVATLLFGLLPALHATRVDLAGVLRAKATSTCGRTKLRSALVAGQVTIAVVLVVGAGLLARSLYNVGRLDPGFDTGRLVVASLAIAHDGGPEPDLRAAFQEVRTRAAGLPGVREAALSDALPLSVWQSTKVAVPGTHETIEAIHQVVGSRYFDALGQVVLRGRGLEDSDGPDAVLAVAVNQELARALWPDSDPVGQTLPIAISRFELTGAARVVGVVADVRQDLKVPPRPQLYLSAGQVRRFRMNVLIRTAATPDGSLQMIRDELSRAHPNLAIVNVATFERQFESEMHQERINGTVGGVTASLGLLVAASGIVSVLTYLVRSRRRETAVRVALGATPRDVLVRTLLTILGPVALGVVLGVAGAVAVARLLRAQLVGIDALDPLTLAVAALTVTFCAALAAIGPSMRASRIDPSEVLREE